MRKTKTSILTMAMMLGVGLAGTTLSTTGSEAQEISCSIEFLIDVERGFPRYLSEAKYQTCLNDRGF